MGLEYNEYGLIGQQKQICLFVRKVNLMIEEGKENELTKQQKYFICNQCFFWAYQIVVIALGLTVMGLVILAYNNTKTVLGSTQYKHAEQTVALWKQGYIIDIRAENTNNCPQGYTPLITYEWPGSVTGCYCNSASSGYNFAFVLTGQCSSNLISLGCQIVSPMNSQILNMWKGGSLLCYKRANAMNFYNSILTSAPSGGSSPNMTACAVNQTYQTYTLPGVPCPLSSFSNQTLGSSQTQLSLDLTNNYNLNFVSQNGYPISDFKLTEYQFCQFFNQSNISPNKNGNYLLQKNIISSPCSSTDPRMVAVDQLNEEDFYTNNTRIFNMIETLPNYPRPSVDYKYILGFIPYPQWTYQCRTSSAYNLYIATDHILFNNTSNSLNVTASVTVPALLVLAVLIRIYFIIRHLVDLKSRKTYNAMMLTEDEIVEQIPTLDIKKSYKKQCCLFVIQSILLLGSLASIVYSIINTTSDSTWIKQIVKYQCTDSYLQNIFLYYEGAIDQISATLTKASFVWGVLFLIHIIYFVTRNYIGDLYSKKEVILEEIPSVSNEPLNVLEKQGNLEGVNMQDSSDIILNKESSSEIKIYEMDYLMGDGGAETKDNFYVGLQRQASLGLAKKKKKKKQNLTKKKKNLFKDDQL